MYMGLEVVWPNLWSQHIFILSTIWWQWTSASLKYFCYSWLMLSKSMENRGQGFALQPNLSTVGLVPSSGRCHFSSYWSCYSCFTLQNTKQAENYLLQLNILTNNKTDVRCKNGKLMAVSLRLAQLAHQVLPWAALGGCAMVDLRWLKREKKGDLKFSFHRLMAIKSKTINLFHFVCYTVTLKLVLWSTTSW